MSRIIAIGFLRVLARNRAGSMEAKTRHVGLFESAGVTPKHAGLAGDWTATNTTRSGEVHFLVGPGARFAKIPLKQPLVFASLELLERFLIEACPDVSFLRARIKSGQLVPRRNFSELQALGLRWSESCGYYLAQEEVAA